MEFCPIQVEIKDLQLKQDMGYNYLLQVWTQEGRKVFQKCLKNPVTIWAISNEYFIYKPESQDENSDCYHITNLKKDNATMLLPDFLKDPTCKNLAYHDGILYTTNRNKIFVISCKDTLQKGEIKKLPYKKQTTAVIQVDIPIHSLFLRKEAVNTYYWKTQVIVAMETRDNQLDFSVLLLSNFEKPEFAYTFKQCREVVPREIKIDPIKKVSFVIDKTNTYFGIALRESGQFDLYWNMQLVDTVNDPESAAVDIAASFDQFFFKLKKGFVKQVETKSGSLINFFQTKSERKDYEFSRVFYQNIKNSVNIFNSFTLIRTILYLAHGPYLSLYNISEGRWLKHVKFEEGDILRMVKVETKIEGQSTHHQGISVLLKSGSIYNKIEDLLLEHTGEGSLVVTEYQKSFDLNARIIKVWPDSSSNLWVIILTKNNENKASLHVLHQNKLFQIEGDAIEESIDEEEKAQLESIFKEKIVGLTGQIHSTVSINIREHIFLVDDQHCYRYNLPKEGTRGEFKKYPNQNIAGCLVVDGKFSYTLSHSSEDLKSGLRLYDINNILKKDKVTSFLLDDVQVGCNGIFDWNSDYSRITFQKSFDTISIVPALHRNTISLIGMEPRSHYLATKTIKDKFIALNSQNELYTWSIVTGKLLEVNKLALKDYSGYTVFKNPELSNSVNTYNREWYTKILLISNQELQPETQGTYQSKKQKNSSNDFYLETDDGLNEVKNQITFVESLGRKWHQFKLIEILNEKEVEEHLSFQHPVYPGQYQNLYFDNKNKFMLEKLQHPRIFLYSVDNSSEGINCKWRLIKRFTKFPHDLESNTGYLQVMSPCFEYYIDIDRALGNFVIRDTITSTLIYQIKEDLMDSKSENPRDIMNRFMWINKDRIRIVNKEGIEKLIELRNGFEEVEYNMIPLFDNSEVKNTVNHFYKNRQSLKPFDAIERLKRSYQLYVSAYYLDDKKKAEQIYQEIFAVDYQIDDGNGLFYTNMSFTFLHWKIIEQLEQKTIDIDVIDDSQIELLCYNILPKGNTILHVLYKDGEAIQKIFETAQPDEENKSKMKFHVPFIQNLLHKSPMHNCRDVQEMRIMNTMLSYLCGYGIDHHSKALAELLPFIIENSLPSILDYIDSRLQQTQQLRKIKKGVIKPKHSGIMESQLWFDEEKFKRNLMVEQPSNGELQEIERPIKVEFIDIPRVYNPNDELCNDFYSALADTDNYELFGKRAIQKLIEFNYPIVKKYTIFKLFIPFNMFQFTLYFYLNFVFQQTEGNEFKTNLDMPLQILLGLFSLYFLSNEFTQMRMDGLAYLSSIWNYLDITSPSIVLSILFINAFEIPLPPNMERTLQAVGVFFMWLKLLYFFRIFKSFGYLIRLIILVIDDMRTFLGVFFFTIIAFSDSLLTISKGNTEENQFVTTFTDSAVYTYRLILGDFDVSAFGTVAVPLVYTLFILCTVFNTIVMLNLLIAIISETYSKVKENAVYASFQEMASMIAENMYLIPTSVKKSYVESNRYIVVLTDLENEINLEDEIIIDRINTLRKQTFKSVDNAIMNYKNLKKYIQNEGQESFARQEMRSYELIARADPNQFQAYSPPSRNESMSGHSTRRMNSFAAKGLSLSKMLMSGDKRNSELLSQQQK